MPQIAPHIAWNNVEGELVLFDTRAGTYHALNGTGAAIWRAIAAGSDAMGIVETLAVTYDVPCEILAEQVRDFIESACAKNLLEISR